VSLQELILDLVKGFTDPEDRIGIAMTINYLRDLYIDGKIDYNELKKEIHDVLLQVIMRKNPTLTFQDADSKAKELTEQFMRAIQFETLRVRMRGRFRIRL
jgi:hypothetical protein